MPFPILRVMHMALVCRPFSPLGDCNYSSMGYAYDYWMSALQALEDCVLEFTTNCRASALLPKYYYAINKNISTNKKQVHSSEY